MLKPERAVLLREALAELYHKADRLPVQKIGFQVRRVDDIQPPVQVITVIFVVFFFRDAIALQILPDARLGGLHLLLAIKDNAFCCHIIKYQIDHHFLLLSAIRARISCASRVAATRSV